MPDVEMAFNPEVADVMSNLYTSLFILIYIIGCLQIKFRIINVII